MTDVITAATSINLDALVDRYLAGWNETDRALREALIAETWTKDGTYVDPNQQAEGQLGISEMIAGFLVAYPGLQFSRIGDIDQHHGQIRFRWQLTTPDGAVQVFGTDVGALTPEGLLVSIVGFFDPLP